MKKIFLLAVAAISLAACNNDDNYIDEPIEAQVTATIGQSAVSRAAETQWAAGDSIGVTMLDRYANIKYSTALGDGKFAGTTMYFKNKRESVNLIAYYPFTGDEGTAPGVITATTSADKQTSAEQANFDFLHARLDAVSGSNPEVKFEFSHKMSKLTLIFKNGNTGIDVSKITSYSIEGLLLDGTFDTASGVCAANSYAVAETLSISLPEGAVKNEAEIPSLILFPQSTADKTVTLKIHDSDDQDYSCELNFGPNGIEAGNNYQWTITVNKTGISVAASEIKDWTTKESGTGASSVLPAE